MIQRLLWWTWFLVSTFALSKVFAASRLLTSESPEASVPNFILWLSILVLTLIILGHDAYMKAKREDKLVRQVGLFEWIDHQYCKLRHREKSQ